MALRGQTIAYSLVHWGLADCLLVGESRSTPMTGSQSRAALPIEYTSYPGRGRYRMQIPPLPNVGRCRCQLPGQAARPQAVACTAHTTYELKCPGLRGSRISFAAKWRTPRATGLSNTFCETAEDPHLAGVLLPSQLHNEGQDAAARNFDSILRRRTSQRRAEGPCVSAGLRPR